MRWTLALVVAGTGFLLGIVAVREHASVVRAGYELSGLEARRRDLVAEAARARSRVGRLGAPRSLVRRAREIGLGTEYTEGFEVVRVGYGRELEEPVVARND